jgi:hypothetical protein
MIKFSKVSLHVFIGVGRNSKMRWLFFCTNLAEKATQGWKPGSGLSIA